MKTLIKHNQTVPNEPVSAPGTTGKDLKAGSKIAFKASVNANEQWSEDVINFVGNYFVYGIGGSRIRKTDFVKYPNFFKIISL